MFQNDVCKHSAVEPRILLSTHNHQHIVSNQALAGLSSAILTVSSRQSSVVRQLTSWMLVTEVRPTSLGEAMFKCVSPALLVPRHSHFWLHGAPKG